VDADVVERFARALETGDVDGVTQLLADDVWGIVDDGTGRRKPTLGARAVGRQWANAFGRYGQGAGVRRVHINGEAAILIDHAGMTLAAIHLETRDGRVIGIRTLLDPPRLARLGLGGADGRRAHDREEAT
jgi:RNA polymerase sigma-70 factor (ECF subfamily)